MGDKVRQDRIFVFLVPDAAQGGLLIERDVPQVLAVPQIAKPCVADHGTWHGLRTGDDRVEIGHGVVF